VKGKTSRIQTWSCYCDWICKLSLTQNRWNYLCSGDSSCVCFTGM